MHRFFNSVILVVCRLLYHSIKFIIVEILHRPSIQAFQTRHFKAASRAHKCKKIYNLASSTLSPTVNAARHQNRAHLRGKHLTLNRKSNIWVRSPEPHLTCYVPYAHIYFTPLVLKSTLVLNCATTQPSFSQPVCSEFRYWHVVDGLSNMWGRILPKILLLTPQPSRPNDDVLNSDFLGYAPHLCIIFGIIYCI